jgi:hypothetical protein
LFPLSWMQDTFDPLHRSEVKMTLQRTCHAQAALPVFCIFGLLASARPVWSEEVAHNYPTYARVEYVNDCVVRSGKLASLYQCSCAIDRIAQRLSYDSFVEASTFAKYSGLPGEGGAIFRDSDAAQGQTKLYRKLEADAWGACGLGAPPS